MSEICLKLKVLAIINFIVYWLLHAQNKLEIMGFNFPTPQPRFMRFFKMVASRLNMPHNDPSKATLILYRVPSPGFGLRLALFTSYGLDKNTTCQETARTSEIHR